MSPAFNTSLWTRAIRPLVAGTVQVATVGPAKRHMEPTVTATAEGQKLNGRRAAVVLRPSDVSRLDRPHSIPHMQTTTKTTRTMAISRSVGLEAASINV